MQSLGSPSKTPDDSGTGSMYSADVTPPRRPPGLFEDTTPEKTIRPGKDSCSLQLGNDKYSYCSICTDLDALNNSLCEKLYAVDDNSASDDFVAEWSPDFSQALADTCTTKGPSDDLYEPFALELEACKLHLASRMQHLEDAAHLALRAANRCSGTDLDIVECFLEMYYYNLDPIGIQERLDEQKEIEDEIRELRVCLAGHFFTYDRHRFWKLAHDMPEDLRRRFVEFGILHPIVDDDLKSQMSQTDMEQRVDASDPIAYSWQEEYNDDDDDTSDLLKLLRLLRELADLRALVV